VNLSDFIGRHFWLVCFGACGYNYFAARRLRGAAASNRPVNEEAQALRRTFALVSILPWLVMGFGQTVGGVPNVWHYFRPQDGNPYVVAFPLSIFLILLCFACWVLVFGGAKKVVELALLDVVGWRVPFALTEGRLKLIAALGPPFVILWVLLLAAMNVPLPRHPREQCDGPVAAGVKRVKLLVGDAPVIADVRRTGPW
jgi:hypothetical protein